MSFTEQLRRHLVEGIELDQRRRRGRRRILAGTAAVLGVALIAAGAASFSNREDPVRIATGVPTPPTAVASDPSAGAVFELVGTITVWTGTELFVWGGTENYGTQSVTDLPGVLYDPDTGRSRPIPGAPGGPQAEAVGVWTGSEVIICCGRNSAGQAGPTLAFDPATSSWRELPAPPIEPVIGPAAVWVDDRVIVVTDREMAAYTPATNSWSELTPPPVPLTVSPGASIVATNDAVVVWPRPSSRTVHTGLIYDLSSDTWSELPPPPAESWPAVADIAWTGHELIVIGGLPASSANADERLVGSRLDWATKQWEPLPDVWPEPVPFEGNLGSQSVLWNEELLLVLPGFLGTGLDPTAATVASYDPTTDAWQLHPSLPATEPGWHSALIETDTGAIALVEGHARHIDLNTSATRGFPDLARFSACDEIAHDLQADDPAAILIRLRTDGLSVSVPTRLLDRYRIAGYTCASAGNSVLAFGIGLSDPTTEDSIWVEAIAPAFLRERTTQPGLERYQRLPDSPDVIIYSTTTEIDSLIEDLSSIEPSEILDPIAVLDALAETK
ncbi:MAG: hypothetical protein AAGD18_17485 [Actinomycetota bacterium]